MVGAGLSYALAVAFIVHLAIRAYWVGMIGLKSTFPTASAGTACRSSAR